MILLDVFQQLFNTLLAAFVTIPVDNTLGLLYVIANFLLQLFGASLGG
jgi:hypothetical protein